MNLLAKNNGNAQGLPCEQSRQSVGFLPCDHAKGTRARFLEARNSLVLILFTPSEATVESPFFSYHDARDAYHPDTAMGGLRAKERSQRGQPTGLMRGAASIGQTRYRRQAARIAKRRSATAARGRTNCIRLTALYRLSPMQECPGFKVWGTLVLRLQHCPVITNPPLQQFPFRSAKHRFEVSRAALDRTYGRVEFSE